MRITLKRDDEAGLWIFDNGTWRLLPMGSPEPTEYESTTCGWKRVEPPPETDYLAEAVKFLKQNNDIFDDQQRLEYDRMAAAVEQAIKFRDATRYTSSCWAAERDELHARIDELEAREVPPTELAKLRAELDQTRARIVELEREREVGGALLGELLPNRRRIAALQAEIARARARIAELEAERDRARARQNNQAAHLENSLKQMAKLEADLAEARKQQVAWVAADQRNRELVVERDTLLARIAELGTQMEACQAAANKHLAQIAELEAERDMAQSERAELEQLRKLKIEAVKPATCPTRDELLPCPRCGAEPREGDVYPNQTIWTCRSVRDYSGVFSQSPDCRIRELEAMVAALEGSKK